MNSVVFQFFNSRYRIFIVYEGAELSCKKILPKEKQIKNIKVKINKNNDSGSSCQQENAGRTVDRGTCVRF